MFASKVFRVSLLLSATLHGLVLLQNSGLSIMPARKNQNDLEVVYLKLPPQAKGVSRRNSFVDAAGSLAPAQRQRNTVKPSPVFPKRDKDTQYDSPLILKTDNLMKPLALKSDITVAKKKISLPPLESNKINSPAYLSYYQLIREKIRRAAYRNYNRLDFETGEVYLSFVVLRDGSLAVVKPLQNKSAIAKYLLDIGLQSVKDAAPFPAFPGELDYPQIPFNVLISFQME